MVKVSEMMSKNTLSVPKATSLGEIIHLMSHNKISCVLIADKDKLVGIITERDLTRKILYENMNVKKSKAMDIMTKDPITIGPNADLAEASQLLHKSSIRHLPVTENGKIMGLLTQTDIVRETHKIHKKNVSFMTYQNIQSAIIIIFFIFLALYIAYRYFRSLGFFS